MASGQQASWASLAAATALALAAAVPLLYYKLQQSAVSIDDVTATKLHNKEQEQQEALKLLRKVELIVGEVAVRLMHTENQAEDLLANEGGDESAEAQESTLNSYYHFDSQGNKLKTKWDSYDIDAELEKLDKEEEDDDAAAATPSRESTVRRTIRSKPSMDKPKILTSLGGIEHEFEAVLEFLDGVRGDERVREARKTLITKITSEHFARIDAIRAMLA